MRRRHPLFYDKGRSGKLLIVSTADGKRTLADCMSRHRGVYSLLVLKNNTDAKKIWKHLFEKNGYRECTLDGRYVSADDCDLLGFEPIG